MGNWNIRCLLSVIKKLIEGNLERVSQFLQRLNRWDGVTIFDAGNVTSQQSCSLLNFSLRKTLRFPQKPQPFTNHHFSAPFNFSPIELDIGSVSLQSCQNVADM